MSNILAPIVTRYRAFFTVAMFSSSRLVRSAHAGQLVQQLVIDAQHTYQTLVLNKQRAITSKYTQYQTALYRNSSKSSSSSATTSSAASSPGRSTLSSLDTDPSAIDDNDAPNDTSRTPHTAGSDATDQPQQDAHHGENADTVNDAVTPPPSSTLVPQSGRLLRIRSSATLMSLALACILLGLLQARRRNLKRMRRLLRNSQRLSKRGSRLSSAGGNSASASQRSTPAHSLSRRQAAARPAMPFGLERIPSESRVSAWLEEQEHEQLSVQQRQQEPQPELLQQQQPQQQPSSQSYCQHAYQHQYPQYPEHHHHAHPTWQYQAQQSLYPVQPQPHEQYQQAYEQQPEYAHAHSLPHHHYHHHHYQHPAPASPLPTRLVNRQWRYSTPSYVHQFTYEQHQYEQAVQQYPQYQAQQYAYQATFDDYDHTPGHRRSLSLTNVSSTFRPIHTSPVPHSPTAQVHASYRDSLLPQALEPEVLGTGTMSPAELAREQHRLHRERYQIHHQQLRQQQQQQQQSPHQHYYHRSTSPVPRMGGGGSGRIPIRSMSPPLPSTGTIFAMNEHSSIIQKRTAQQLAWERHHYYQQQQAEEDARVEREAQMVRYQRMAMHGRPVSMLSSTDVSIIGRSISDGRIHQSQSHHPRLQQQFGNVLHVENEAVVRTSSLSRSVAASLSPQTAQALGIQRSRTARSGHNPEKRWSGWFVQRGGCKGNEGTAADATSNGSSGGMIERVIRKASVRFRKTKMTPPPIDMDLQPSRLLSLAGEAQQDASLTVSPSTDASSPAMGSATMMTPEMSILYAGARDPAEARKSMTTFRGLSPSLPSLRNLARRCTLSGRPKSYAAPSTSHRSLTVLALEAEDFLPATDNEDNGSKEEDNSSPSLGVINAKTKARHLSMSLSETSLAVLKEAEKQKGSDQEGQEIKYYPPTGVTAAAAATVATAADGFHKDKPRVHRRVTLSRSKTVGRPRSQPQASKSSEFSSSSSSTRLMSSSLALPGFGESMRLANGKGVDLSTEKNQHSEVSNSQATVVDSLQSSENREQTSTAISADSEEIRRTREQVAALLAAASRRGGSGNATPLARSSQEALPRASSQQQMQQDQASSLSCDEVAGDRTMVDPYADIAFMLVPKSRYAFQPLASAATAAAAAVVPPVMDYRQTCSIMGN